MKKAELKMKNVVVAFLLVVAFEVQGQENEITVERIMGVWTDGSFVNASFAIEKDSIYYVDAMVHCKYTLTGDTINIYDGNDISFTGAVDFKGDTLLLIDKEEVYKLWPFKD